MNRISKDCGTTRKKHNVCIMGTPEREDGKGQK